LGPPLVGVTVNDRLGAVVVVALGAAEVVVDGLAVVVTTTAVDVGALAGTAWPVVVVVSSVVVVASRVVVVDSPGTCKEDPGVRVTLDEDGPPHATRTAPKRARTTTLTTRPLAGTSRLRRTPISFEPPFGMRDPCNTETTDPVRPHRSDRVPR
jgi:hypothetical protein